MSNWRRPLIGGALALSVLAGGVLLAAKPAAACDICGHYGPRCDFVRFRPFGYSFRRVYSYYPSFFYDDYFYPRFRVRGFRHFYRDCDDDDD